MLGGGPTLSPSPRQSRALLRFPCRIFGKVRRKLAESLRGNEKGTLLPSPAPATPHAGAGAAADSSERDPAEGGTGEAAVAADAAAAATAAAVAAADAVGAAHGAGGDFEIVEVLLASATATLESAGQQLGQHIDPAARAAVERQEKEEQLEDPDKPLVLTGTMEMLGTALVVLPAGDVRGARHCVG